MPAGVFHNHYLYHGSNCGAGVSAGAVGKVWLRGFLFTPDFRLISLVPSLVTYSRKELSLRQGLIRKALHLIALETTLIVFGFWGGVLHGSADAASFAFAVVVVYLLVNIISWELDRRDAVEINKALKSLQDENHL